MAQWGREERAAWPPYMPIYSYTGVAVGILCTLFFLWQNLHFWQTPLQRSYATEYIRSKFDAQLHQHGKYRLIYLGGSKRAARLALPSDFIDGLTLLPGGKSVPVMLSPAARTQGYRFFYRAPSVSYRDASLYRWLRLAIFGGEGILRLYTASLAEGLLLLVAILCYTGRLDYFRIKELKYGRRLKGPEMVSPKQFNEILKGTGLGIRTNERNVTLRIPEMAEAKHIQVMGDTGAGKTTLLFQMLRQIEARGESAIVYDPAGEFIQCFYREGRGDVVLNPMDARCPYWSPSSELRTPAEARTIAASLYQPNSKNKGEFFTETPQKIFARLLLYRPTPHQLAEWMANEEEIDKRVEGTPMKSMIAKGAQQQRSGVLGSLGLTADGLLLLPTRETAKTEWSATKWAEKRQGWIFLSGKKSEREALRPLHSLWIDLLILRLLELPEPGQKRAWFVLDEVASLQRLPQFHTALTEGRKSNNPIIFGYQGKAQVEDTYAQLAEVMLSQPATKFILKTAEPKAAKWASELLGEVEIERVKETHVHGNRHGRSFTVDRQIEPLVMGSEIEGLADLHSFVKLGNYVSRFSFPRMALPPIAPAFVPRTVGPEVMWLDTPGPAILPDAVELLQDPEDEPATLAEQEPAAAPDPPGENKQAAKEQQSVGPDLTLSPELERKFQAFRERYEAHRQAREPANCEPKQEPEEVNTTTDQPAEPVPAGFGRAEL